MIIMMITIIMTIIKFMFLSYLSQMNQAGVKGFWEIFLNLRTQSREERPRKIIMDSIRMNLDSS